MITLLPAHTFAYAGARVNVYHANKGEGLPRHEHVFQHGTVCAHGSIVVRKEGIERIITKDSQPVSLRENEWHEIEALEDGTVFFNIFEDGKS